MKGNEQSLMLGSIAMMSLADSRLADYGTAAIWSLNDASHSKVQHRMNWALWKAPHRVGVNRTRYITNRPKKSIDFGKAEKWGMGELCQALST